MIYDRDDWTPPAHQLRASLQVIQIDEDFFEERQNRAYSSESIEYQLEHLAAMEREKYLKKQREREAIIMSARVTVKHFQENFNRVPHSRIHIEFRKYNQAIEVLEAQGEIAPRVSEEMVRTARIRKAERVVKRGCRPTKNMTYPQLLAEYNQATEYLRSQGIKLESIAKHKRTGEADAF